MIWNWILCIMRTDYKAWAARQFIESAAEIHPTIQAKVADSGLYITMRQNRFIFWISA